jgi:hypothetical protein
MANFLSDAKKQQVIALGQLGWTLRPIQAATGVRRETGGADLKAAGLAVRPAGRWGQLPKTGQRVSTDPETVTGRAPPGLRRRRIALRRDRRPLSQHRRQRQSDAAQRTEAAREPPQSFAPRVWLRVLVPSDSSDLNNP